MSLIRCVSGLRKSKWPKPRYVSVRCTCELYFYMPQHRRALYFKPKPSFRGKTAVVTRVRKKEKFGGKGGRCITTT